MWAVGSPSVTMMICLVPVWRVELLAGQQQRVLHVRAPLEVPAHLGQQLGLHLAGDAPERHEAEVVARELAW